MRVTKQGVRDLNKPINGRKIPKSEYCFHDFKHDPECIGCWGRNFGNFEDAVCEYSCTGCGKKRE